MTSGDPEAELRYAPFSLWIEKAPYPLGQGAVELLWIFPVST